jgi:hypothetical protein
MPSKRFASLLLVCLLLPAPMMAQWLKYPTAHVPRTRDGAPDLTALAPRAADGKPDFSGMWLTADAAPCAQRTSVGFLTCGSELPMSRFGIEIGAGVAGGLPYRPAAAALVQKRKTDLSKDDPHARCLPDTFIRSYGLPHIQKYVHVPGLLVMLDEDKANYRQVFTDGRPLPEDPTPAWNGYSSGVWDGDTLVVDSIGFRDDLWLDTHGDFIDGSAKVRERIRRPDFGHLAITLTVDDPSVYTGAWTVHFTQHIVLDTELVDEICLENEKSVQRMKGK